ncbi:alpha/beta hydrolase fold domain-containing protein [Mycobacterium lepromatosis]|uniref:alpha/beta hydrolase fold domain-containing protein n=1 Tax=Mycobacterium lepromatosis TaxID=480418 RepID=UPI000AC8BAFE|nr:alpha/beta hydrolase fold domain-containing protein [Mycobacterium lepromatosis]
MDRFWTATSLNVFLTWYVPPLDIRDYTTLPATLAPANAADLSSLPPTFIDVTKHDPSAIRRNSVRRPLNSAGVPTKTKWRYEPTMVHGYISFALGVPASRDDEPGTGGAA